jgi:hypothetical protein
MEALRNLGFAVELVLSEYDDGCQEGGRESEPVNHVLVARRQEADFSDKASVR